jgi:integrase
MSHQTDTLTQPIPMPRHTHLLRRGSRYYVNVKVPKDLLGRLKKDIIRKSLNTSDPREAVHRVRIEGAKIHDQFEKLRGNLRADAAPPRDLSAISENEAYNIVFRYFTGLEKISEGWWENEAPKLEVEQLAEALDNLRADEVVLTGGNEHYQEEDGSFFLNSFLREQRMVCTPESPIYQKLRELFRRAELENTRRTMDRIEKRTVTVHDPLFRDAFAHTQTKRNGGLGSVTIGDLLRRFAKAQSDAKRSAGTQMTYKIPARIVREVLGEQTPVVEITPEDIERLGDLLRQFPKNAAQRYRGLTLQQAIAEAKKRGDVERLGPKTLANYFNNIVAVFNFAVEKQLISHNPTKGRLLRESFNQQSGSPKAQFTMDELNRLFRAPLYTGCKNDEGGYSIAGPNKPRRGRFWVPLLSLFHGLRLNEAAQLYTEDVKEVKGIHYLAIREEREDGSKCDKRLKTKQSKRDVPIHPELIRIGFLDFVAARRKDSSSPRLFPELPAGSTGYFSNPFSKWFARFVEITLGASTKATFHSFRHQFRDATRAARLSVESVARLAGWERGDPNQNRQVFDYGRGVELLRMLAQDIAKVNYPGLDLSHLYTS